MSGREDWLDNKEAAHYREVEQFQKEKKQIIRAKENAVAAAERHKRDKFKLRKQLEELKIKYRKLLNEKWSIADFVNYKKPEINGKRVNYQDLLDLAKEDEAKEI